MPLWGRRIGSRPEARGQRLEGTAKQPENFGAILSRYPRITQNAGTQNAGTVPGYFLRCALVSIPRSQGDPADVLLSVLENRPNLGRTVRLGRAHQCSLRARVPRAALRSALGYLILPLWGGPNRSTRKISVITQQATDVLRLQLRPRCTHEQRDKADTAVMQAVQRRVRAELRKGK